jgi:hypothetical protein
MPDLVDPMVSTKITSTLTPYSNYHPVIDHAVAVNACKCLRFVPQILGTSTPISSLFSLVLTINSCINMKNCNSKCYGQYILPRSLSTVFTQLSCFPSWVISAKGKVSIDWQHPLISQKLSWIHNNLLKKL